MNISNSYSKYFIFLIVCLGIKTGCMLELLPFSSIGLGPDEAQYWTWSQQLDWGYYSKPPAIAWEIWLGTFFFGSTETGVRTGALVLGFLIPLAVFSLAKNCSLKPHTAFWAALIMALSPLGFLASLLATTDAGMILFWILACLYVVKGLKQQEEANVPLNYPLIGVMIALGALFKWPIYVLWIFILALTPFSSQIFIGIAISLLGLLPSLVWNSAHQWVTFRHVLATLLGGSTPAKTASLSSQGNFIEFIGAQAALLSPLLFLLLLISWMGLIRLRIKSSPLRFCGWTSLSLLLFCSFLALFQKIQGNWGAYLYSTAIVFFAGVMLEEKWWGPLAVKLGVFLSVILTLGVLSIPFLQSHDFISFPYKMNPFKHTMGWSSLSKILLKKGYEPTKDFLFGDKYQMTSLLSFYGPEQKRAYFLNLHGIRQNQFSYWSSMREDHTGKTGYFILVENSPHFEKEQQERIQEYYERLSPYFAEVEFLGIHPLVTFGEAPVKGAFIFRGKDYNGKEPATPALF